MRASADAGGGLEVRGMRCERGARVLFDALDFAVPCGAALAVVGPNGSGKTTLLRALAGLAEAAAAQIAWQGEPVSVRSQAWRARIAYLGHKPGHKEELSVAENLELACALDGARPSEADRVRTLCELGLATRSSLAVKRLSQGQKQRLALARLQLCGRALWLLDEPAAALDVDARALLGAILQRHLSAGGVAVIATHDPIKVPGSRIAQLELAAHAPQRSVSRTVHDAAGAAVRIDGR